MSCGAYKCDASMSSCLLSCGTDDQCIAGDYCGGGSCVPKKAQGQICTQANECTTGFCVDGRCCNGACAGSCRSCSLAQSPGVCSPVPLTRASTDNAISEPGLSTDPRVVWSGTQYLVVWRGYDMTDGFQVRARRVSATGGALGTASLQVARGLSLGAYPRVVWTGSEFIAGWNSGSQFPAQRLNTNAAPIGTATNVVGTAYTVAGSELAWNASSSALVVLTTDSGTLASLSRATGSLGRIGDVTVPEVIGPTDLATGPSNGTFGIVGNRNSGSIRFLLLDPSANVLGPSTEVLAAASGPAEASVAWSGSEFGVTFAAAGAVHFRRVSSAGTPLGSDQVVGSASSSARHTLVRAGSQWFFVADHSIQSLGDDGLVSPPLDLGSDAQAPALAAESGAVGVAWVVPLSGSTSSVRFVRVACSEP